MGEGQISGRGQMSCGRFVAVASARKPSASVAITRRRCPRGAAARRAAQFANLLLVCERCGVRGNEDRACADGRTDGRKARSPPRTAAPAAASPFSRGRDATDPRRDAPDNAPSPPFSAPSLPGERQGDGQVNK